MRVVSYLPVITVCTVVRSKVKKKRTGPMQWPDGATAEVPPSGKKKYRVRLADGRVVQFGDRQYQHFQDAVPFSHGGGQWSDMDHADSRRRENYRARHAGVTHKGW